MRNASVKPSAFSAPQDLERYFEQLGLGEVACYLLDGERLILNVHLQAASPKPKKSRDNAKHLVSWPDLARLDSSFHYTSNGAANLVSGWVSPTALKTQRNTWPNRTVLYIPEQTYWPKKLVLATRMTRASVTKKAQISAKLERLSHRLGFWLNNREMLTFVSDTMFQPMIEELRKTVNNAVDHDLRNPLAVIAASLGIVRDVVEPRIRTQLDDAQNACDLLVGNISRLSEAIQSNSLPSHKFSRVPLEPLLKSEWQDCKHRFATLEANLQLPKFALDITPGLAIDVHEGSFRQIFRELFWNAIRHAHATELKVQARILEETLVVDIIDNGVGVAAGFEDLIFQKFFRGPRPQQNVGEMRGMGIGLALARSVAERHMGSLNIVRQQTRGCTFRITLPMHTTLSAVA